MPLFINYSCIILVFLSFSALNMQTNKHNFVSCKTERMYREYVKTVDDLASPWFMFSWHVVLNWFAKLSLSKASIT